MMNARKFRKYLRQLPGDAFKVAVMLLFVFPFYYMMVTSFKTYSEAIRVPPTMWPENFTFEAYNTIFTKMNIDMGRYALNSVLITLGVIVIQMLVMIPAAYAFARFRFFRKGLLFGFVLVAFMIPSQVTFITVYLTMSDWNLIQTLWPQILPFGANAFGIFLLRQGFMQVPQEIIESAKLDNANDIQLMTRIMLPMSMSFVITIALFSFVSHWNSYFWPLVMTNTEDVRPLTMAIQKIKSEEWGVIWTTIMAGNMILFVPVVIIYLFASKRIIQAFAYKGVK